MIIKRPTKQDLENARNKTVADVIVPNLKVLFCGINPSLYTAAVGHHFAHPSNRFWSALYKSGLTSRLFVPEEEKELLKLGIGITNLVQKATPKAEEIGITEFVKGKERLLNKIRKYKPNAVVFLGIESFKKAFGSRDVKIGEQKETIENTRIWVLPNTSGLSASYTPEQLVDLFVKLKKDL